MFSGGTERDKSMKWVNVAGTVGRQSDITGRKEERLSCD